MDMDHSDKSTDEMNAVRPKIESDGSTSSKSKAIDDCPILMLPDDILAKIIAYIPIGQWCDLELFCDLRPAVAIAWRQLRNVNAEPESDGHQFGAFYYIADEFGASTVSILQRLTQHSPFLTSLSGIDIRWGNEELNLDAVRLLAQFEHLQSITMGQRWGVLLEYVVEFLESTRSRTSLKEIQLTNVIKREPNRAMMFDPFAITFVEIDIPFQLMLEKLSISEYDQLRNPILVRLDTMDTTRLVDLRLGNASVEPEQLSSVIERAPNLDRIELSFLFCAIRHCNGRRLQSNKNILSALAAHEKLSAIKFNFHGNYNDGCKRSCANFGPEFIQMLKTIGRRGQLRRLALGKYFVECHPFNMSQVHVTIHESIPHLQSIKQHIGVIAKAPDIFGLMELQEIHLTSEFNNSDKMSSVLEQIAHLSHLKRLAVHDFGAVDENSLMCLADATTLVDLRFSSGRLISADVFVKWSDGFGPNLEILMLCRVATVVYESNTGDERNDYEEGLVRLLEKAVRLRVVILGECCITDRSLTAIAKSCSQLEIFGVRSDAVTVQALQEVVDRCPKLKQLGGIPDKIREKLHIPKYRKIRDMDMLFWDHDFDDTEYN